MRTGAGPILPDGAEDASLPSPRLVRQIPRWLIVVKMGLVLGGLLVLIHWAWGRLAIETTGIIASGVILALVLNQAALYAAALRLRATLAAFEIRITARQAMVIHLRSLFYFFFVPMSVGLEISRFIMIRRLVPGASTRALLIALLLDRILGLIAAVGVALALAGFILPARIEWAMDPRWFLLALALVLIALLVVLAQPRLRTQLTEVLLATRSLGARLMRPLLLSFVALGLVCASVFSFAWASGILIGWWTLTFAIAASLLGMAIPLSLLGASLGDVAGAGALTMLGLAPSAAILLASVVYSGRLIGAMQGSLLELWGDVDQVGRWRTTPQGTTHAPTHADQPPRRARLRCREDLHVTQRETDRTITDFGDQWVRFTDNSGYYGSPELFTDLLSPLLEPDEIQGLKVADIGSGTGRIVAMLLAAGASQVTAIEPSRAFSVLAERFATETERVHCHQGSGEAIAVLGPFDLVVSFGVLHHIPDPAPVVRAAYQALRPGGRLFVWLYGREGNGLYLAFAQPLRAITKRLPDRVLEALVWTLDLPLSAYMWLCRWLPLPMRAYMRDHLGRLAPDKRRLTIFDQLNPSHAKYYRREEAQALLATAGFQEIRLHHRHGYSWSVMGTKPLVADGTTGAPPT